MRFKHLFLASLAAFAMASCSEDVIEEEINSVLKDESTSFVKISLVDPSALTFPKSLQSRAVEEPGYYAGSADENKIKEILLVFYDAGRNYVGRSQVFPNADAGVDNPGNGNGLTVERVLTTVAKVELPGNINYPKYVLAYVNPTSASGDLATEKLEDVMTYIRNRSTVSHEGYRTMNNSVYFQDGTGYPRFATEVDFTTQFFATEKEAREAENANIDIYVERVEAKVQMSYADGFKVNDYKEQTETDKDGNTTKTTAVGNANGTKKYSLKFVPEGWFVNATEKRTFLIKNYRSTMQNYFKSGSVEFDGGDYGRNLTTLQAAFAESRRSGVNSETNHRSFWAIDPTYFNIDREWNGKKGSAYPEVSYDVKYEYGKVNDEGVDYSLAYQSYDYVTDQYNKHTSTSYVKFNGTEKTCEYVLENTMALPVLKGGDAMASMTSVVLLGHYIITDDEGQEVFNGTQTTDRTKAFYVRHEGDGSKYIMLSDDEAIDYFIERSGSTFFVKEYAKETEKDEETGELKETGKLVWTKNFVPLRAAHFDKEEYGVSRKDFKLIYPTANLTSAGRVLSEQWRTLTLELGKDGLPSSNIYIFDVEANEGNGGYRNITKDDLEDENKVLYDRMYSAFGVLERFETGKAYFNVPLKHIWGNLTDATNKFNGETVLLGDYGVVRNHIYDLTINSISGLGTGIGDLKQPIVPPTETDQYYINARLNILKWRVVKQSVDL